MSESIGNLLIKIKDSKSFIELIGASERRSNKCDNNISILHKSCFKTESEVAQIPICPRAFTYLIMEMMASRPQLFDDAVREEISSYYRDCNLGPKGLMSIEYLEILNSSKSPTLTWIKYENLITYLIKKQIYEPKVVANELLVIVKNEIPQDIASRFASVIEASVKYCREASKNKMDEEEEEKWCEIIDWISWFIGSADQL